MTVSYRVEIDDAHEHRFRVTVGVPRPAAPQEFSLPVWIPGSYLVREFARHVSGLTATQGGRAVAVEQLDKAAWRAHCAGRGALTLSYLVHAYDASVRGAWLDAARGFFNGTSLFVRVHGREHESQRLLLGALPRRWEVATSMPRAADGRTWQAADYDELVDHPFELGAFERRGFRAAGVDFEVAVTGAWPGFDSARLAADLQRIAAVQVAFWHGRGRPAFERYLFLVHARDEGHGGLEHRASSALLVKRADLPRRAMAAPHDGYLGLLALASHELFHAWSVKRLKPREFAALDYTRENATHLLWFFEGITSYYDELMLLRAGLVDAPRYLRMLEHPVAAVRATPGRHVQSLAQASFDAWTRYYRPDEHTPNTTVSYYAKGALLGLALDLALRTAGRGSLDDVMRLLWRRCERAGLAQDDVEAALREVAGRALPPLREWVHGTADLPLEALLRSVGVTWTDEPAPLAAALGLRLAEGPVSGVQVRHVLAGSAAARAGVAAGDELLAVDGWRVRRFDDARQWIAPGTPFDLLLVRDQRLLTLRVTPAGDAAPGVRLALDARAGAAARRMRMRWLGA